MHRSVTLPAATLLLAFITHAPAGAQAADAPSSDAGRPTASVLVGRPSARLPGPLGDRFDGTSSIRAAVSHPVSPGIEIGLRYERARFQPRYDPDVGSVLQAVSATVTALPLAHLPVRPFLEVGPSLVRFDDGRRLGDLGGTTTQLGGTLGAGVRLPIFRRLGGQAAASVMVTSDADESNARVFSSIGIGLTLGL